MDEPLPLHPLSVVGLINIKDTGIFAEDDHVELLGGVLAEVNPLTQQQLQPAAS